MITRQSPLRYVIQVPIAAAALCITTCITASAADVYFEERFFIMESGTLYQIWVSVAGIQFHTGESVTCHHTTKSPPHYFAHTHKNYEGLPLNYTLETWNSAGTVLLAWYDPVTNEHYGSNLDLVEGTVAPLYATIFPDSAYSYISSFDPTSNCHGYSTGYNTWIDDMSDILADDYRTAPFWTEACLLTTGDDISHSVYIEQYDDDLWMTTEKMNISGVYSRVWASRPYPYSPNFGGTTLELTHYWRPAGGE
jgi:hypothetical protein